MLKTKANGEAPQFVETFADGLNPEEVVTIYGGVDFVILPQNLDPQIAGKRVGIKEQHQYQQCPVCHNAGATLLVFDAYNMGAYCCQSCAQYSWVSFGLQDHKNVG